MVSANLAELLESFTSKTVMNISDLIFTVIADLDNQLQFYPKTFGLKVKFLTTLARIAAFNEKSRKPPKHFLL